MYVKFDAKDQKWMNEWLSHCRILLHDGTNTLFHIKNSNIEGNKTLVPTRMNVGRINLFDWETRKQGI